MLQRGLKLLAGKNASSVCRGAEILAQTEQAKAIEALLPMLRSRSETIHDCVRQALDRMDVPPSPARLVARHRCRKARAGRKLRGAAFTPRSAATVSRGR
jgi:hypothetical protein